MLPPYCEDCRKVCFLSRGEAKKVIKRKFPHQKGKDAMQAYKCPVDPYNAGWFHIGHKRGMSREQHREIWERKHPDLDVVV